MQLESLRLKNFRALADATISGIPKFAVFVGANGAGKSTIFTVFQFLRLAMANGAEDALYQIGGGLGFDEVRSRGRNGPIEIELQFRSTDVKRTRAGTQPLVTYSVSIDKDENGRVVVEREILKYRRGSRGQPWHFLDFTRGVGRAITNELDAIESEEQAKRRDERLRSPDLLAIKALSQFEDFPASKTLGELIENWYVSDFHIEEARLGAGRTAHARHLSETGQNYQIVLNYLYNAHRPIFDRMIENLIRRIPGLSRVEPKRTDDGNILLNFHYVDFDLPILAPFVSDGTIRMLAYLMMLNDPEPFPLLCVEEPENQLYPSLLGELAEEFRAYGNRDRQVFVTTHSPDFLNAVELDEVFFLTKVTGFTQVRRGNDDVRLTQLIHEGAKLGDLWREGFIQGLHP